MEMHNHPKEKANETEMMRNNTSDHEKQTPNNHKCGPR